MYGIAGYNSPLTAGGLLEATTCQRINPLCLHATSPDTQCIACPGVKCWRCTSSSLYRSKGAKGQQREYRLPYRRPYAPERQVRIPNLVAVQCPALCTQLLHTTGDSTL